MDFRGARRMARHCQFAVLYLTTLGVNVLTNHSVLNILPPGEDALACAFILATGLSAALNFLGMKFWVFRFFPHSGVRNARNHPT